MTVISKQEREGVDSIIVLRMLVESLKHIPVSSLLMFGQETLAALADQLLDTASAFFPKFPNHLAQAILLDYQQNIRTADELMIFLLSLDLDPLSVVYAHNALIFFGTSSSDFAPYSTGEIIDYLIENRVAPDSAEVITANLLMNQLSDD